MTIKAAEQRDIVKEYLKAITPATGTFTHFATDEEEREHLRQVHEAQSAGAPF